jgi:phosphoglycerate dehydrogenase-like enzyme
VFVTGEHAVVGICQEEPYPSPIAGYATSREVVRHMTEIFPRAKVAIATPFDDFDLVQRIRETDSRVEVRFEPDLIAPPRFPSDHEGIPGFVRSASQERRWQQLLAESDILFGLPANTPDGLRQAISLPRVRWVHCMWAGAGELAAAAGITDADLQRVALTTSSGVHAGPLAEYVLFGILEGIKDYSRIRREQHGRAWAERPFAEISGRTVLVLGTGAIGKRVAQLAGALGMQVIGVRQHTDRHTPFVDELHSPTALPQLLPRADVLVVALPLTDATRSLITAKEFALLPQNAVVINVGRGPVIDEKALIEALQDGKIASAVLDVFTKEPLPSDSPLWDMENVIITPHYAGVSIRENERIVDIFIANLRRHLANEPMLNRVESVGGY